MSELFRALERESESVDLLPGGFERLLRRRDRNRRNQRLASGVLALVLAAASIAGLLRAFGGADQQSPAAPSITPGNVSDLQSAWSAKIGPAPKGPVVAIADGMVLVQADDLYAFPQDCAASRMCQPAWIGRLPATGGFSTGVSPQGLTVSDGTAYVAARDLYAFPTSCADGGATCRPEWVGDVGSGYANQPVVSGDSVYVGTSEANGHGRLYVFPKGCGSGTCAPSWVSAPQPDPLIVTAVSGDVVYATSWGNSRRTMAGSRIYAFPTGCTNGCEPNSVRTFPHEVSIAIAEGKIFVGSRTDQVVGPPKGCWGACSVGTIHAYPETCAISSRCDALWTVRSIGDGAGPGIAYVGGVVFAPSMGRYPHVGRAYAADSGKLLWAASCCTHGASYQSPVVADGLIWVTSGSGTAAYPVDCETGGSPCEPSWTSLAGEVNGVYHVSKAGLAVSDSMVVRATKKTSASPGPRKWRVYAFTPSHSGTSEGTVGVADPGSSHLLVALGYWALAAAVAAWLLLTRRRRTGPE